MTNIENVEGQLTPTLHTSSPQNRNDPQIGNGGVYTSSINNDDNAADILKNIKLQNINRLVITETKLDDSYPKNQFTIDGYSAPYRNDFNKNSGGVIIFVRDDLVCKEVHKTENNGEGIFLELNLRKMKWLLFGGYNHKKSNIKQFLNEVSEKLEPLLSKFDDIILLGDFNSEIIEEDLSNFSHVYNLKNLIVEPTCFKNVANPSSIDVILTNKPRSFQNSQVIETGLSDYHKMTITVLRIYVKKQAPNCIQYRDYSNYDSSLFNNDLRLKLNEVNPNNICYATFENIFMNLLNKHAKVKKKLLRANNAPFMTKALSKAIMNRSRLKNRFLKNPSKDNELKYKKQRNYVVGLLKKEKKKYFTNLNLSNITNNKTFWKTVKPFFF